MSQILDPQYGDLRDAPVASTSKTHTFRAHLVDQVGPDVNGRATAFCQPHPGGRLLQTTGRGTSDFFYDIKTKWTSGTGERFLIPDPLSSVSEATDSVFTGEFDGLTTNPLVAIPGTDSCRIWNPDGLHMQTRTLSHAGLNTVGVYVAKPTAVVAVFPNGITSTGTAPTLQLMEWDYSGTFIRTTNRIFVADAGVPNSWYIPTQNFGLDPECSWISFNLIGGSSNGSLTAWGPTIANPDGRPNTEDILRVAVTGAQTAYNIERIPGYVAIQGILQRVRTVGLSLLGTNLSSDFDNGGLVAAGTLPGGTVGDPRFSWTSESLAALPDNIS